MPELLATALVLWKPGVVNWEVLWVERWGLVAAFFGLQAIWRLRFRHWIFPLALSYFLCATLAAAYGSPAIVLLPAGQTSENLTDQLRAVALAQAMPLACFLAFLWLPIRWRVALKWLGWVCLLTIFVTPQTFPIGGNFWLGNTSMAATLGVVLTGAHPLAILPALWGHSWVGCLAWGLATAYRLNIVRILIPLGAAFVLWHGIPDNGRLGTISEYAPLWLSGWREILFGLAPGSTRVWLPALALDHQFPGSFWIHSHPVEALFELGAVGAVLVAGCIWKLWTLAHERSRPELLAWGVACAGNFPLHWTFGALGAWALFKRIALTTR